jgi:hypothetical protein
LWRRAATRNRRLIVEAFEDRWLLATLVNTGTAADVIYTLTATTDQIFLEDDARAATGAAIAGQPRLIHDDRISESQRLANNSPWQCGGRILCSGKQAILERCDTLTWRVLGFTLATDRQHVFVSRFSQHAILGM